jgi:membrane dipeptidase
MTRAFHDKQIAIDSTQYSLWDREVLQEMKDGGFTAVNVTLVIWENARETLDVIGKWHQRFLELGDLIMPIRSGKDILEAKKQGKVGIIFGAQNTSMFEDDLYLVSVFNDLGMKVVQLTYNIQNYVGGSCYEKDIGLTRFGRFVVEEMNRLGMVVDGSHTGEKTFMDACDVSSRPCVLTHANPTFFADHPRNKSSECIKKMAATGGVIGLTCYPHLTGGKPVSLEKYVDAIKRTVDLVGIDHVGFASDASRKFDDPYLMWIRMGRWSIQPEYGAGTKSAAGWLPFPDFFATPAQFPMVTEGLLKGGFSEADAAKVIGGNWYRVFNDGFEPAEKK